MIKKLKTKFVLLTAVALFMLLLCVVAGMNLINYGTVVTEADEILMLLSENRGTFPEQPGAPGGHRLPPHMSPELPFEARYFSVMMGKNGDVTQTDTGKIASIDPATAEEYGRVAYGRGKSAGFVARFRYLVRAEQGVTRITFLDCGRQLDAFYRFLSASVLMALVGFCAVTVMVFFLSGRIIQPILRANEKQKRFITDASHEIKTPLTIIGASADVLELEMGGSEHLEEIRAQTKRLSALTRDLVELAKLEESEGDIPKIEFPISEIVSDTVGAFKTLIEGQGKTLVCRIQPMLSLLGNSKAVEQLVCVLMENAVKYSPAGTEITVTLARAGKTVALEVGNVCASPVRQEQLQNVFDRFYRMDDSRNTATGGYGIGLSVAKAIADAHGGKITASTRDGNIFFVQVILPG